jgi:glycosyltransferase involved in cell wall biosynthesis
MTQWLLGNCDAALAVSHALARDVAVLAGGRVQPKVVYNGVTEDFHPAANRHQVRQQLGLPKAARIILFVGRCEMDKGAGDLLRAFRSIAAEEPSAVLLFVGEGGARQDLERHAGSRVLFAGHVGRERITLYLQAADIFALPSHGEGMPNALLEAMAVGLPCVAARVGGIPEAIEDGVNGLLIPMQSPADIAAAVNRVFKSPDLAARLGSAAMRTVKERFTWNGNAREHLAIYEETIRKYHACAN